MATRECSICLDELKDPIAIPCGHIHCDQCLFHYVEESPSATEASCPTCRTMFPIVQPDLRLIPEKFRPFIMTSMRRIYLPKPEENDQQTLLDQIRTLEKRVKSLKKDKLNLIERCESLSAECDNLVRREADLQEDYDSLEVRMHEAEDDITHLEDSLNLSNAEVEKWKKSWTQLSQKHKEMKRRADDKNKEMMRKLELAENALREQQTQQRGIQEQRQTSTSRTHKRNSEQAALDTSTASSSAQPSPAGGRVIHPIPKRPRLQRLVPEPQFSASNSRGLSGLISDALGPPNFSQPPVRSSSSSRQQYLLRRRLAMETDSEEEENTSLVSRPKPHRKTQFSNLRFKPRRVISEDESGEDSLV